MRWSSGPASFSVPVIQGSSERSSRSADHFMQNSLYRHPSHLKDRQNGSNVEQALSSFIHTMALE
jgi:hypothetical protein